MIESSECVRVKCDVCGRSKYLPKSNYEAREPLQKAWRLLKDGTDVCSKKCLEKVRKPEDQPQIYIVEVPFHGVVRISVRHADDEEEALLAGVEHVDHTKFENSDYLDIRNVAEERLGYGEAKVVKKMPDWGNA